jgi:hypothetical protein
LKDSPSGALDKIYGAKMVAKEFTREKGVNCEVYSTIVKYATTRLVCVLVALFGLAVDQMDAVTDFLCGTLDEEIFLR